MGIEVEEEEFSVALDHLNREERRQILISMIDQGLNENRYSNCLNEESQDDATSALEGHSNSDRERRATTEKEDIIQSTRELLASLLNEQENVVKESIARNTDV